MRLLLRWFVVAVALAVTAWLVRGVEVADWTALLLGSAALGLVNAVARPVLAVLTFPITVLTLGLFIFVVNGISFALAAWLVPGFTVHGLWPAILGAIVVSIVSWLLSGLDATGRDGDDHERDDRR